MIIDKDFLSSVEIDGISSTIFSQEVPVLWTIDPDNGAMMHYCRSNSGEESKFNKIPKSLLEKFCIKNNITNNFMLSSRILLVSQSSKLNETVRVGTFLYPIDDSDANIIIDENIFEIQGGVGFFINAKSNYQITSPKNSDFAAIVEVSFIS
jgi:hypothetical protein